MFQTKLVEKFKTHVLYLFPKIVQFMR